MTTPETQRDSGYTSIQQPVERLNYPAYSSQEAIEVLHNSYYKKYGPPAFGQPQTQEGAFQASKSASETLWKGGEKNLAAYYENDPSTRWSLEKALNQASKGRRISVGLKSARNIMSTKWPDYHRSWLFHIDPFQIQGWNLLHHIVLNKENNAIQMYLFPPYKIRNLRFSELGPEHAVAGWEVPLEQTQATTLMRNAPLRDILHVLHHDNIEGSVPDEGPSIDEMNRPSWLESTRRPAISTSELRNLNRDIRNEKTNYMDDEDYSNELPFDENEDDLGFVDKNVIAAQSFFMGGMNNIVQSASQISFATANDEIEQYSDTDPMRTRTLNSTSIREMEVSRVNINNSLTAVMNEIDKKFGKNVKILTGDVSSTAAVANKELIDQINTVMTINQEIGNKISSKTIQRLYTLIEMLFDKTLMIIDNQNQDIEALEHNVSNSDKKVTPLEETIKNLQKRISEITAQYNNEKADQRAKDQELQRKSYEIKKLENEVSQSYQVNQRLSQRNYDLTMENDTMRQMGAQYIMGAQNKFNFLEMQLKTALEVYERYAEATREIYMRNTKLNEEVEDTTLAVSQRNDMIRTLLEEMENLKRNNQDTTKAMENYLINLAKTIKSNVIATRKMKSKKITAIKPLKVFAIGDEMVGPKSKPSLRKEVTLDNTKDMIEEKSRPSDEPIDLTTPSTKKRREEKIIREKRYRPRKYRSDEEEDVGNGIISTTSLPIVQSLPPKSSAPQKAIPLY